MLKSLLISSVALVAFSSASFAAGKTYQVTGPVLEINDSAIVVQKGKDKWEIAKGSAEVPADVKVGSKVTIEYSMTAVIVTDKSAKKAEKAAAPVDNDNKAPAAAPAEAKKEDKKAVKK